MALKCRLSGCRGCYGHGYPTTPVKVPAPYSSFKFLLFDGLKGKWIAHNKSVTQSLKIPYFAPDLDAL